MFTREAPPFHIWNEGDVHELVCSDRAELKSRMAYGMRNCDIPECEWCTDTRMQYRPKLVVNNT